MPPDSLDRHYLTPLLEPASVAIVGASPRPGSIGAVPIENMLSAGFRGALFAVNPKHRSVAGVPCVASIREIPQRVDLAVIVTPAARVPGILDECAEAGVRAACVISAGFEEAGPDGAKLQRALVDTVRRTRIRMLGPNCLGLIRPHVGLNATFARGPVRPGALGFISQSAAICTAMLDWAAPHGIGFSSVISLGGSADVDFGELVDYLVSDARTRHILLYIEGIRDARRFMSALRAAARVKPVILMKSGRRPVGSRAAASHTGAMIGSDDVFDAAVRRAGVVRVNTIGQLVAAAHALSAQAHPRGDGLAVITNGGGPGVMAADRAADLGIPLAELSSATVEALKQALPSNWSLGNPIDLIGDADAVRYARALDACLADPAVDGVLTILTPQAMTAPLEVAREVVARAGKTQKPLLTCWMGGTQVAESIALFAVHGIPSFRTPDPAVEMFAHVSAFYRNQKILLQTPGPIAHDATPDLDGARLIIEAAFAERRSVLSELESKALLAAFRIPIARAVLTRSANEAMEIAEELGFPVVMKIDSPDIMHKSDAGGVKLNVDNAQAVHESWQAIHDDVARLRPNAQLNGLIVQPMVNRPNGRELMIGVVRDPVFGPAITFGLGGIAAEVLADRAVALPPLNGMLVDDLVRGTRAAKLLQEFRHMPAVDHTALEAVLLRVSEMTCELPEVHTIDINPIVVDETGAVVLDARIVIERPAIGLPRYGHMAIHPYPTQLVAAWTATDGTRLIVRPIRPEDAEIEHAFVRKLSPESRFFRFMNTLRELTPQMLVRFTQIDYDREMAFIAVAETEGEETEVGVARYITNPDGSSCEFAIVVADDWQGRGLGRHLMSQLIEVARAHGLAHMIGHILTSNRGMLTLVTSLGFEIGKDPDDPTVRRATRVL
jgi:acetyltransferase